MHIPKLSLNTHAELLNFIIPFLVLFFLAILVATNGIGSNGLILIFAFIAWFESDLRVSWWRVVWPWLLVIAIYSILMSFNAFSQVTALRDGGEVLKGVALSLVALYLRQISDQQLRRVTEFVVIVLATITMGIIAYNLYQHSIVSFLNNQMFDWYVNRNRLAVGFSVTSVFIAALMVGEKSSWKSILLSTLWMLLAVAALLNGSRGAIVAMICATICIVLAAIPQMGWKQVFRLELWILPISVVVTIVGWIFYRGTSLQKFLLHDGKGFDTGRFDIWKTVGGRVMQSPWFGYGSHAMKYDPMLEAIRNEYQVTHPHSIYIGLVYASGVVGILFWLCFFVSFVYRMNGKFRINNELSYYLGIGLLVNILVHGLVDFDFYMFTVFVYIIVGLIMILPKTKSHINV